MLNLKNFSVQVILWAALYFLIIVLIDYVAADEIFTTRYFIKKIVIAIIGSFLFSILLSSKNPIIKKQTS
jgi:hypothetical protein